jgi:hypothetical protein
MSPLRRRPKQEDADKWIQKDSEPALTSTETVNEEDAIQSLRLRIPQDLLQRIDRLVKKRQPKNSRHQWILEALLEKASREERKESK